MSYLSPILALYSRAIKSWLIASSSCCSIALLLAVSILLKSSSRSYFIFCLLLLDGISESSSIFLSLKSILHYLISSTSLMPASLRILVNSSSMLKLTDFFLKLSSIYLFLSANSVHSYSDKPWFNFDNYLLGNLMRSLEIPY